MTHRTSTLFNSQAILAPGGDPPEVPDEIRTPEQIRRWAEENNLLPKVGDELGPMKVVGVRQSDKNPLYFDVTGVCYTPTNYIRVTLVKTKPTESGEGRD